MDRKFEKIVKSCYDCPNWYEFGETTIFICHETGEEINPMEARKIINDKCTLPLSLKEVEK